MTTKILGPEGSKRRKRFWLVPMMVAVLATVFYVAGAQAVHDLNFELDGNVTASTMTDWDSLFNADGTTKPTPPGLPAGFKSAKLSKDFVGVGPAFVTSDTTTFATGSKDTLPISGWQCNFDNNVNSKVDVMNAYAASYTAPDGDQIIYFGLERNTNTGDANVAFWFLQDAVGCETDGASETFVGEHKDGDLLIVSAFSKGGNVSTIDVYRWERIGPAPGLIVNPPGVPGFLNTTPVATGVDCRTSITGPGDKACAVANTGTITTPWKTANFKDGVGNQLLVGEFFEGGLNLTDSNLGGKCFNVFIGDTRSSTSLTSTLFDFAQGTIGECTSKTVTTPNITTPTIIPASGTLAVTDEATVTVTGVPTLSGTVNFFLCGPLAVGVRCDTGGVPAGSGTITEEGESIRTSDSMTVTEVGRYCWRAVFSGDESKGVPGSSDSRENECFTITPRQSTLDTQAGTTPVSLGDPVTDTATLGNTANQEGSGGPAGSTTGSINPSTAGAAAAGTITFTLFKADCTTLATGTGTNPQTATVSGDADYGPVTFIPDAPGTYHWVASYNGDSPNTLGSTHNTACGDPKETVVVRQIPTTTVTTPTNGSGVPLVSPLTFGTTIFDKAVVTANQAGGPPVAGTVAFTLTDPNGLNTYVVGSAVAVTPSNPATSPPSSAALSTPGIVANIAGTWCFSATFTPSGTAYTGSVDQGGATECVEVSKAPTSTVTTPSIVAPATGKVGDTVTDTAVVTALSTFDGYPSGTIDFYICNPIEVAINGGDCDNSPGNGTMGGTFIGSKTADDLGANLSNQPRSGATSAGFTVNAVGTWCFRAEYVPGGVNGGNYTGSTDARITECFTIRDTTSATSQQNWLPNDHVVVSSAGLTNLKGALDITLVKGTCNSQTALYTKHFDSPVAGWPSGTAFDTTNSTYKVAVADNGTYFWRTDFVSSDPFVDGFSLCEKTDITINDAP